MQFQAKVHRLSHWRSVSPDLPRFIDGNCVVYLEDGEHQLAWMLAGIRRARRRVDLEMYIFQDDRVGLLVRDALAAAARRGVAVRVLFDSVGSAGRDFFDPLVGAGGTVLEFNPLAPWRRRIGRLGRVQAWLPNQRDHRKLLLCDVPLAWLRRATEGVESGPPGEQAAREGHDAVEVDAQDLDETVLCITGGRNIADEYLGRSRDGGQWRDGGMVVGGPVGVFLGTMFDAMWSHAAGPAIDPPPFVSPAVGEVPILPLGSQPGLVNLLAWAMSRMAATVRNELRISCAYFVPSLRWRRALRAVGRKTGSCTIIIPLHNDLPVVAAASRHYLGFILRGGVHVARYARAILHDKTMIYDRVVTVVGSSNLDPRSLRLNFELSLIVLDRAFGELVARAHERDLQHSEPYTLEAWRARPLWEKAIDWFWSLFRSQL